MIDRFFRRLPGFGLVLILPTTAFASNAAPAMTVDKGDTAWMLVSTLLVLLMIVPGLALFCGGLVRAKNVLSILTQTVGVTAVAILVWVGWGYSLTFEGGGRSFGGTSKLFLKGITDPLARNLLPSTDAMGRDLVSDWP